MDYGFFIHLAILQFSIKSSLADKTRNKIFPQETREIIFRHSFSKYFEMHSQSFSAHFSAFASVYSNLPRRARFVRIVRHDGGDGGGETKSFERVMGDDARTAKGHLQSAERGAVVTDVC